MRWMGLLMLTVLTACGGAEPGADASTGPVPQTTEDVLALFGSSDVVLLRDIESRLVTMGVEGLDALEDAEDRVASEVGDLKRRQLVLANQDRYDEARALSERIARIDSRRRTIRRAQAEIRRLNDLEVGPVDCSTCGASGRDGIGRCGVCDGDGLIGN